jgi:hypothetical protein
MTALGFMLRGRRRRAVKFGMAQLYSGQVIFPLTARRERAQSYLEAAPLRRIGVSASPQRRR